MTAYPASQTKEMIEMFENMGLNVNMRSSLSQRAVARLEAGDNSRVYFADLATAGNTGTYEGPHAAAGGETIDAAVAALYEQFMQTAHNGQALCISADEGPDTIGIVAWRQSAVGPGIVHEKHGIYLNHRSHSNPAAAL